MDVADDDSYYPQRMPSSTRRYTTTGGQQVIQQGNKRLVIHKEPPPPQPKRTFHWLSFVGLAFLVMLLGWMALTLLGVWWSARQEDWKYGTPRTFQMDQFVGHHDSPIHPNHFVAINIGGTIEVVEMNTTTPKDDHIYVISTISSSSTPATLSFSDINHDGKRDMLVTIGESNLYTVVLLNTGSVFQQ
ncbi:MAG: hypothetical protein ABI396_18390 [Ktedonobacteraceae bacterium]